MPARDESRHNGTTPARSSIIGTDQESFDSGEGDAELQDPSMMLEAATSDVRSSWRGWICHLDTEAPWAVFTFYDEPIGSVPEPALDSFTALELALRSTDFIPTSRSATYSCRMLGATNVPSLHAAGAAIDIDWSNNPYSSGDRYAGSIKRPHVEAILRIRNTAGRSIWAWGGHWPKPARMHFQLDVGPQELDVDWSTVAPT